MLGAVRFVLFSFNLRRIQLKENICFLCVCIFMCNSSFEMKNNVILELASDDGDMHCLQTAQLHKHNADYVKEITFCLNWCQRRNSTLNKSNNLCVFSFSVWKLVFETKNFPVDWSWMQKMLIPILWFLRSLLMLIYCNDMLKIPLSWKHWIPSDGTIYRLKVNWTPCHIRWNSLILLLFILWVMSVYQQQSVAAIKINNKTPCHDIKTSPFPSPFNFYGFFIRPN